MTPTPSAALAVIAAVRKVKSAMPAYGPLTEWRNEWNGVLQALARYDAEQAAGSGAAAADGWRPIETAPRDGTHIIVPGGTAIWSPAAGAWFSDQAQRFIEWPVTVWQPLPPPPARGERGPG